MPNAGDRCNRRAVGLVNRRLQDLPTPTEEEAASRSRGIQSRSAGRRTIWDTKGDSVSREQAGPFQDVTALARRTQCRRCKIRQSEKAGQFALDLCGQGRRQDRRSQNPIPRCLSDVDVDGDGKADVRAQIGPAINGTTLRDSLDFVNFNAFKNQIQWAEFGKSFNTHVKPMCLQNCCVTGWTARRLRLLGAYVPAIGTTSHC